MEREKREIASLTKIMTLYTALKLIERLEIDAKTALVEISENASDIEGTSASLEAKDVFTVWELLHGLMLPSGNDAAIALAEYFGELIMERNKLV